MNRSKKSLPKNLRKKITKSIRKNLQAKEDTSLRILATPRALLSQRPKKKAKIEHDHLLSMQKSMSRKKARLEGTKLSKRTTPSEGVVGSVPSHPHKEGARWVKTLRKQTLIKNSITSRKAAKLR
jgi:hypothetical protein